jgi:hypothetical protein
MTAMVILAAMAGVLAVIGGGDLLAAGDASRRARARIRGSSRPAAGRHGAANAASNRPPAAPRLGAYAGVRLLAGIGRRLPARPPSGLGRRIEAAGVDATAAELMALKAGSAVTGLALVLLLSPGLPDRMEWLILLGGPLVGFLCPDE